jgi:CRISPR/Cas system-associated protein Cas5 (RAMP superfamily)
MAADKLQKENLNQELEKKKKPRNTKVASPAKPAQAAKEMAPKKNVLKKHNKKKTVKKHKKKNMKQVIEATKKPATSSTPSVQQLDQAEDATICYSDHIMEYKLEKYSKAGSVGIRRMFGDKKQIFSLRNNNWSFAQLLELGQLVTTKLKEELAGKKCSEASEVAIKAFAMSRLKHSE